MMITVAFDVKNYVEVMEGWPIVMEGITFSLEREGNVLTKVCLTHHGVDVGHAPVLQPIDQGKVQLELNTVQSEHYVDLARKRILSWQTVTSAVQIVDLDYDNCEIRFRAENFDEDALITVKSISTGYNKSLNASCDFEQIGRAFCAGSVSDDRIESTSHFREGRIAYEASRFVDAYNNIFLFLETRYCDGQHGNRTQANLLSRAETFCEALEEVAKDFLAPVGRNRKEKFELFKPTDGVKDKIWVLVKLRGELRHHSLKNPGRWDPNQQNEYENAARFLQAVVGRIVMSECFGDIYSPAAIERFKEISVSSGNEIEIKLTSERTDNEPTFALDMKYPTTVVSSVLCLTCVRNAIDAFEKEGQLGSTVRFEATNGNTDLEVFSLNFGVWAYTKTSMIKTEKPIKNIRCSFECFTSDVIVRRDFSIPVGTQQLGVSDVWKLLVFSFDHIEKADPTTRVMSLKLFVNDGSKAIVDYRVGAQINN